MPEVHLLFFLATYLVVWRRKRLASRTLFFLMQIKRRKRKGTTMFYASSCSAGMLFMLSASLQETAESVLQAATGRMDGRTIQPAYHSSGTTRE